MVKISNVSTVVPAKSIPPFAFPLSNLDLISERSDYYFQAAYIFSNAGIQSSEISSAMDKLKNSLSQTLSEFPMLAGRLRQGYSDKTEVYVNGKGIPFYEAIADEAMPCRSDLRNSVIDLSLNPKNTWIQDKFDVPLLRIQATVFSCGGLAVGLSALHIVMDGISVIDFMKAWGEISRGLPFSNPPCFERGILKARDAARVDGRLPSGMTCFFQTTTTKSDIAIRSREPVTSEVFVIADEAIEQLALEIQNGCPRYGKKPSAYEAISSLLWCSITRARGLVGDMETGYTIPINLRGGNRFNPPLPTSYFGNAVVMVRAKGHCGTLIQEGGLLYAARQIRSAIQSCTPNSSQSLIDWLELRRIEGKEFACAPGAGVCLGREVVSTAFPSFPLYSIDLGWGSLKQFKFSVPLPDLCDGLVAILPGSDASHREREVLVCLPTSILHKMKLDPFFSDHFLSC